MSSVLDGNRMTGQVNARCGFDSRMSQASAGISLDITHPASSHCIY